MVAIAEAPSKVLIVEDEQSFLEALTVGLTEEGFRVEVAGDGEEALEQFHHTQPDVVLLDLMLPKLSGLDVCRTLRTRSQVPIIMVTARTSEIDTVVGLEVGADDYVTKPFRLRELVARIRAVLRRSQAQEHGLVADGVVAVGPVSVDLGRHEVMVRGDQVSLPLKEFKLLTLLVSNAGRVLARGELIRRVWGEDYVGDTKTLDVHIKRLRSKVESDDGNPLLIKTVRGLGYKFEADDLVVADIGGS